MRRGRGAVPSASRCASGSGCDSGCAWALRRRASALVWGEARPAGAAYVHRRRRLARALTGALDEQLMGALGQGP